MEAFLLQYWYWIFFLAVMVFWPAVTIIGWFFIFIGHFNVYIIMPMIIIADVWTDIFYYSLWRRTLKSSSINEYIHRFWFFRRYLESIKNIWIKNSFIPIFLWKWTFSLSIPILMSAWASHVPLHKFIFSSFCSSLIQTSLLLFVGYYLGNSYMIANKQMQYPLIITTSFIIIFLIGMWVVQKKTKNTIIAKK